MTESAYRVTDLEHHPARIQESELLKDCTMTFLRRSGPGGQHRNKVETAVVITHVPSGISAEANKSRSQEKNRQEAISRLRLRLACEIRSDVVSIGSASELWLSRQIGSSIKVASDHRDFPALLAEAMDVLAGGGWDHAAAAEKLGVSSTQFVKFLAKYPPALQKLNAVRSAKNLDPLKVS
jgi:RF-1 domain